jgi:hypothetical protein
LANVLALQALENHEQLATRFAPVLTARRSVLATGPRRRLRFARESFVDDEALRRISTNAGPHLHTGCGEHR